MKIVETSKILDTARKNGYSEEDVQQIEELLEITPDVNAKIVFSFGDIVFCKSRNSFGVIVGEGTDEYFILTDDKLKRPVKISAKDWELDYTGKQLGNVNYVLETIVKEEVK